MSSNVCRFAVLNKILKDMDIEMDIETPDFKCKNCKIGISIYIEEYWEGGFDVDCPVCKTKHELKRELRQTIKLCK